MMNMKKWPTAIPYQRWKYIYFYSTASQRQIIAILFHHNYWKKKNVSYSNFIPPKLLEHYLFCRCISMGLEQVSGETHKWWISKKDRLHSHWNALEESAYLRIWYMMGPNGVYLHGSINTLTLNVSTFAPSIYLVQSSKAQGQSWPLWTLFPHCVILIDNRLSWPFKAHRLPPRNPKPLSLAPRVQ